MANGPIPYRVTKSLATDPGVIGCSGNVDMPRGTDRESRKAGKAGIT